MFDPSFSSAILYEALQILPFGTTQYTFTNNISAVEMGGSGLLWTGAFSLFNVPPDWRSWFVSTQA